MGGEEGAILVFSIFFVWFPSCFVFSFLFRFFFVFSFRFFVVSLLLLYTFTSQVSRPFPPISVSVSFHLFFRDFCNFSLHIYSGFAAGFLAGRVLRGGEEDLLQRRVFPSLYRRYLRGRRGSHLRVVRGE